MRMPNPCVLVVLLGVLLSAAGTAHANCGAEGCPLAPRGPEATFGRFSFNVGNQVVEQSKFWDGNHELTAEQALQAEGGLGHVLEQLTRTRTTRVDADARLTRRLSLSLSVPYVDRVHRHAFAHHANFFIESQWHMQGLGDATAMASWELLDGSRPAAGALTVQVGAKLPTGKTAVAEINGEAPEPPARPGSGSTDVQFGLHYRRSVAMWTPGGRTSSIPLTAGVSGRYNGKGTAEYRMGNELNASVGAAYPLAANVRLLAQFNASQHARDDAGSTDAVPHDTGGRALYASPGVQVQVVPGISAFGYSQFRLYQHSNGPQLVSPYHLSLGIAYALR